MLRCRHLGLNPHMTPLRLRLRQLVRSTLHLPRTHVFQPLHALRLYLHTRLLPQNIARIPTPFPPPILFQQELTRVIWCIQAPADTAQDRRRDHMEAIWERIRPPLLMRAVEVGGRVEYPQE